MNLNELKRKFDEYEKARAEFAKTHKPAVCSNCHREINPGGDIHASPFDGTIFCCMECGLDYHGISEVIFNEGDEDYESWFPKEELAKVAEETTTTALISNGGRK